MLQKRKRDIMSNEDEDDDAKNARDGNLFPPVPSKLVKVSAL